MKKIVLFAAAATLCAYPALAQTKSKSKTTETKAGKESKSQRPAPGYKLTPNGLEYKIVVDQPGVKTPQVGDAVEMHIHTHVGDSTLFNSRVLNNNNPVPFNVPAASFNGDPVEGFMMMSPGDSAVFRVSIDSLRKTGQQLLPWMKDGDMIEYEVSMVSVKSQEEVKREMQERAGRQVAIDDSLIQDYLKRNNIKAVKTPSGMYYKIGTLGLGEMAQKDQNISVNYTGKTLDGNVFDSNVDPKFGHVEPFQFLLGSGHVIKGWDEGLTYFNKGAKGTLFIPSYLAYGAQSPSPAIPANSVLIFDVEVVNLETPSIRMEKGGAGHSSGDGHQHN